MSRTMGSSAARRLAALLALAIFCLAGCGRRSRPAESGDASAGDSLGESPAWVAALSQAEEAGQLFVVAVYQGTAAWISMHEKDGNGTWQTVMTTPGFVGKNGLGKTREGDGMTPRGTFGFNAAFGIAEDPGCAISYARADGDTYWSGDEREGMGYNRMVSLKDLPELDVNASEHIVDYSLEYQYCLNISYNSDCVPGKGSAIFLHCLGARKPYTGGCVAIPRDQMERVMKRVKPDCVVVIDSMEALNAEF